MDRNISDMRQDDLTRDDLVNDAAHNLRTAYRELAGAEALMRAVTAERSGSTDRAMLWVDVYRTLVRAA